MRLTLGNALQKLDGHEQPFRMLFSHGTLEVEIYQPDEVDLQQPHDRDELYVVAAGSGRFENDGVIQPVEPGEVLFVAAGVAHRFLDFSADFATWVFFYGPRGGERRRRDLPD